MTEHVSPAPVPRRSVRAGRISQLEGADNTRPGSQDEVDRTELLDVVLVERFGPEARRVV